MTIARFWRDNASRYNLLASRCGNCGHIYFPPRTVCPTCHRKSIGKMEKVKLKGEGQVYSYSIVHDAPPQYELMKPYVVGIIELDEGIRITGQIIECDSAEVQIGMRVRTTIRKLGEEGPAGIIHYGYKFVPSPKP